MKALIATPERVPNGSLKFISTLQYDACDDTWSGPYKLDIIDDGVGSQRVGAPALHQ